MVGKNVNIKSLLILAPIILGVFLILPSTVLAVGPTADAGPDKEIMEGELVKLSGSGSGEKISYFWSCNGGSLSNPHIAQPNFTSPQVKQDTEFICNLIVSDGEGKSHTDNTIVLVKNSPAIAAFQVSNQVKNLSQGQTIWYKAVGAKPGDKLVFQIMISATGNRASENIKVKDTLPQGLIYQGELNVDGVAQEGDITKESIGIESIRQDQSKRITFSVQVADEKTFKQATTNLTNTGLAFNEENSEADTSRVVVSKDGDTIAPSITGTGEAGAGSVATGIAAKILTSVLFPITLATVAFWIFKSEIIGLDMWFSKRKKAVMNYRAEKKLKKIQKRLNNQ